MEHNTHPSISVVIPYFNVPPTILAEAIVSVQAQDYPVLEILLIDDGSGDPAIAMAVAQQTKGVTLIRHPRNLGGSAARNTGIDNARGDCIAFLDADDIWLAGKLSRQVAALLQGNNAQVPDNCFVASNCLLERGTSRNPCNAQAPAREAPLWHYFLVQEGALQTSTLLLPANLARRVRFKDGLPRHQDWDFIIRLEQARALLVYLHDCLSVYRLRDDPLRISRNPRAASNSVMWLRQMRGTVPTSALQQFFFNRVLARSSLRAPFATALAIFRMISISPVSAAGIIGNALRGRRAGKRPSMRLLRDRKAHSQRGAEQGQDFPEETHREIG